MKEHKEILLLVQRIDNGFHKDEVNEVFEELKRVLLAHANFEDDIFYPRLDEELSDEEKQLIYDRCEGGV